MNHTTNRLAGYFADLESRNPKSMRVRIRTLRGDPVAEELDGIYPSKKMATWMARNLADRVKQKRTTLLSDNLLDCLSFIWLNGPSVIEVVTGGSNSDGEMIDGHVVWSSEELT